MMRTIEAETINEAALITRDEAAPAARSGNYEPVRFNAMKHGILSRLVVLAHEDHAEFADLLAALIEEHRPGGMTERHLIEELATIIWRKRRVLLAEGARINEGLKNAMNSPKSVMPSAAPFPQRPHPDRGSSAHIRRKGPQGGRQSLQTQDGHHGDYQTEHRLQDAGRPVGLRSQRA
jgi:hypothetical protein